MSLLIIGLWRSFLPDSVLVSDVFLEIYSWLSGYKGPWYVIVHISLMILYICVASMQCLVFTFLISLPSLSSHSFCVSLWVNLLRSWTILPTIFKKPIISIVFYFHFIYSWNYNFSQDSIGKYETHGKV